MKLKFRTRRLRPTPSGLPSGLAWYSSVVALTIRFVPLSDAYFYLNLAKGLPSIATASEYIDRNTRTCVLLAFSALEAAVSSEMAKVKASGYTGPIPKPIGKRLSILMGLKHQPFDEQEFLRHRNVRNRIAHPHPELVYPSPPVNVAEEIFEYCVSVIGAFYPHRVEF